MSTEVTRLEELLKTFTPIQLAYIEARLDFKYDYEAAEEIGIARETASRWPNKDDVDQAVKLAKVDGVILAREKYRRATPRAAQEIIKQLDNRNVAVRYKAAKDILDRNIGNAPAKHEVTGQVTTETKVNDEQFDRTISTFADAIGAILSRKSKEAHSDVDPAE